MSDYLQLCVTVATSIAFIYSIALNCFRYSVYEDHGVVETGLDLVMNSTPLAISRLMVIYCNDEVVCNVRMMQLMILNNV